MRRLRGERTVSQLDGRPQDSASTAVLDEAERRDIEPGRTSPVSRAVGGAVDGMLAQLKQLGELKSQGALTGRRVRAADEPDPRLLRCGPLGVRSARP